MPSISAQDVVRRMVEAFGTGDTSEVNSFVAAAYRDHQAVGGEEITGPEGFQRVVATARSGFHDLRVSIEDLIADANRVAVRLRWVGTRKRDAVSVTRETIDIVRCDRGQAIEHWGIRTWIDPT